MTPEVEYRNRLRGTEHCTGHFSPLLPHNQSSPEKGRVQASQTTVTPPEVEYCVGNLSPAMGARNQVGIGLSYRPASLYSLATFQTRFLESIPRPIAGLTVSFPLWNRLRNTEQ